MRPGTARALVLVTLGTTPFGLLLPLTERGPREWLYVAASLVAFALADDERGQEPQGRSFVKLRPLQMLVTHAGRGRAGNSGTVRRAPNAGCNFRNARRRSERSEHAPPDAGITAATAEGRFGISSRAMYRNLTG